MNKREFSEALIAARNKHGHKPFQAAKEIGVTTPLYKGWEAGTDFPAARNWRLIYKYTGLSREELEQITGVALPSDVFHKVLLGICSYRGNAVCDLPDLMGVSRATIDKWMYGVELPNPKFVKIYIDICGISIESLDDVVCALGYEVTDAFSLYVAILAACVGITPEFANVSTVSKIYSLVPEDFEKLKGEPPLKLEVGDIQKQMDKLREVRL